MGHKVDEVTRNKISQTLKGRGPAMDIIQKGAKSAAKANLGKHYYNNGLVRYVKDPEEHGFLSAVSLSGKDSMQVSVTGNSERILLVSRFDNLGKGASGAAIQNMNIAMGIKEDTGLIL